MGKIKPTKEISNIVQIDSMDPTPGNSSPGKPLRARRVKKISGESLIPENNLELKTVSKIEVSAPNSDEKVVLSQKHKFEVIQAPDDYEEISALNQKLGVFSTSKIEDVIPQTLESKEQFVASRLETKENVIPIPELKNSDEVVGTAVQKVDKDAFQTDEKTSKVKVIRARRVKKVSDPKLADDFVLIRKLEHDKSYSGTNANNTDEEVELDSIKMYPEDCEKQRGEKESNPKEDVLYLMPECLSLIHI